MSERNQSLVIGMTLGILIGIVLAGYAKAADAKCAAVKLAYQETHDRIAGAGFVDAQGSPPLLSLPEDLGIQVAGIMAQALGVSCTVIASEKKRAEEAMMLRAG